jgi:hypothetical protein
MDDADRAELQSQPQLDAKIAGIRTASSYRIDGSGLCQVCGAIVKPVICNGRSIIGRWCSTYCRDAQGRI